MTRYAFVFLLVAAKACLAEVITWNSDRTVVTGDSYGFVEVVDTPPDPTTVDILGGFIESLTVRTSSIVNAHGGTVASLSAHEEGTVNIYGLAYSLLISAVDDGEINLYGNISNQTVYGGGSSTVNMFDDSAVMNLGVQGAALAMIHGGTVSDLLQAQDSAVIRMFGGQVQGYLIAEGTSRVELYGYGFTFDPTGSWTGQGLLEGFWLDGTSFSIPIATGEANTFAHLAFLPEPTTVLFFWPVMLMLRRRGQG